MINLLSFWLLKNQKTGDYLYIFITLFWSISSYFTKFYTVNRYTNFLNLLQLIISQLTVFILGYFAYFGLFKEGIVINNQFNNITYIFLGILTLKIGSYYILKLYRKSGGNYRNIIFVGNDENTKNIIQTFKNQKDLGYHYKGFFGKSEDAIGDFDTIETYIQNNTIHEIFASLSFLNKNKSIELNKIAERNNVVLKLIPNTNKLYSKHHQAEFYETIEFLKVKKLPLEFYENRILKRLFDISFSLLVVVFILSWLTPILFMIIKIESKGRLFFKQEREGVNGQKFICYKFRSMKKNQNSSKNYTSKDDPRVTIIGKFIRKTSIDELPQFFNVIFGDMSVVGPRPHIENFAAEYRKDLNNYIKRHAIKPGITGLAQVSGYRGEIKKISDVKNRIRLDIFYIENWSFFLDIKIIISTILNVFKGEENAY